MEISLPPSPASSGDLSNDESYPALSIEDVFLVDFQNYISTLPWDGDSKNHNKAHQAFLRSAYLGIDQQTALEAVEKMITAAGAKVDYPDLVRQLQRAHKYVNEVEIGNVAPSSRGSIPAFDPDRLASFARRVSIPDPAEFLRRRSPHPPSSISSAGFMEHLYNDGERVVVFSKFKSQGQALYLVGQKPAVTIPTAGPEGIWFLVQPVDGEWHDNPRTGGPSRRSQESVTRWPHLVLESDKADGDDWLRLLIQLPLPIVAIYRSGGKSIHGLVRVAASSKHDWDAIKERIAKALVPLGADPGALSAVRLSRLPQCHRGDRLQELLFLNPGADGSPIYSPEQTIAAS